MTGHPVFVETVRAICDATPPSRARCRYPECVWCEDSRSQQQATAALRAVAAMGWRLVTREPTDAMKASVPKAAWPDQAWRLMFDAAPDILEDKDA